MIHDVFADEIPAELVERLRKSAEYLGVLAEQLEAVRIGDGERVRAIQAERTALERAEVRDLDDGESPEPPIALDVAADLAVGLELLDAYLDAERKTEETWNRLTDGAAKSAHAVPIPRLRRSGYPDLATGEGRVDVRF